MSEVLEFHFCREFFSAFGLLALSSLEEATRTLCDSTTLRGFAACMVLIAPIGASHASGMMWKSVLEEILLLDFHAVIGQELAILLGEFFLRMLPWFLQLSVMPKPLGNGTTPTTSAPTAPHCAALPLVRC